MANLTPKEKALLSKCRKVCAKVIDDMSKLSKSERDVYWRNLSDFEKEIVTIGFFKKLITNSKK